MSTKVTYDAACPSCGCDMIEPVFDDAKRYLETNPPGVLTAWQEDTVRVLFGTLTPRKDSRKTAA